MRIGVITTSYPRFPGDGAGSFVGAHVTALRALGHDVEVIAAGPAAAGGVRIPSRLFYEGGAPDALERGLRMLPHAVAFTARMTAEVARRARRWDLAVAHWLVPSALAALPSRVPLLAIAHGGDVHTLARLRLLGPVLRALRARRARLAFVTTELAELARRHGPIGDAIVQPMGVDLAHFAALGRAPTTPPTVLVLARLVPVKGVDVALAAMRAVKTTARLIVAGDGPERAALEHLAATCQRGPGIALAGNNDTARRDRDAGSSLAGGADTTTRIALVGEVDTTRRDRLLREASVVVVPSRVLTNGRTEGLPTVALEALATGVPVIASAVGGLRELVAATHVPPDDPAALAASIDRVLATPPPGDRLRASVATLAWPEVANRLLRHAEIRADA